MQGSRWVDSLSLLQTLEQVEGRIAVRGRADVALIATKRVTRGGADHAVGRAAVEAALVQRALQQLQLTAGERGQVTRPGRLNAGTAVQALRKKADRERVVGRVVVAQDGAKVGPDQKRRTSRARGKK